MTDPEDTDKGNQIRLYKSFPQPCAYIDGQMSVSILPDPAIKMTHAIYEQLAQYGFRRSGNDVYRPDCPECSACRPLRVPVPYMHNRSQKRIWNRNQKMTTQVLPAEFNPEHFDLYKRYLQARHADSQMSVTSEENYVNFLISNWCKSIFIELRENGQLMAVAVTDVFSQALSAVYTFYEPTIPKRSLGTYCILSQFALAEKMGLDHVYLGYWIEECKVMRYKSSFRPYETLENDRWIPI